MLVYASFWDERDPKTSNSGVRTRLQQLHPKVYKINCLTWSSNQYPIAHPDARKQAKSVRDPLAPNKSFPKVACDYKEVCIFLKPRECTTVIWSNLRRYEWKLPLFFFQESICTGQNRSNSRRTGGFAISDKFVWIFPSISLNLICINPLWTLSFSVWTLQ